MEQRIFALGDIHGELEKLNAVFDLIAKEAGFNPAVDMLISLGDNNDRGPDSYGVFEKFRNLKQAHPENVVMILGNHESMMMAAAQEIASTGGCYEAYRLFSMNGGNKTMESYGKASGMYGKMQFARSVMTTGHHRFIDEHVLYHETDKYFFCHAPVGRPNSHGFRAQVPAERFRESKEYLTWNYEGENVAQWVDPNPIPDKLCFYGHIHGLRFGETGRGRGYIVPGIRRYGNSFLIDTGCGCAPEGYLTCVELPRLRAYTSRGEVYDVVEDS